MTTADIEPTVVIAFLMASSLAIALASRVVSRRWLNPLSVLVILFCIHNWVLSGIDVFVHVDWPPFAPYSARLTMLLVNLSGLWASGIAYLVTFSRYGKHLARIGSSTCADEWRLSAIATEVCYVILLLLYLVAARGEYALSRSDPYGAEQALTSGDAFTPIRSLGGLRIGILVLGYAIRLMRSSFQMSKTFYIVCIMLECILAFLKGARKPLVQLIVGLSLVYAGRTHLGARKCARLFAVFLVLAAAAHFTAKSRAHIGRDAENVGDRLTLTVRAIQDRGNGAVLDALRGADSESLQAWVCQYYFDARYALSYGKTYAHAVLNTLILRPFQGAIADWQAAYAFKYIAYARTRNHGWDFAFSAEAVMNFGVWFAWLPFAVLGACLGMLDARATARESLPCYFVCWFTVSSLAVYLRADSTALFRTLSAPIILMYCMFLCSRLRASVGPIAPKLGAYEND